MQTNPLKLAAAAGVAAAIGFGGVSIAGAQEEDSTVVEDDATSGTVEGSSL